MIPLKISCILILFLFTTVLLNGLTIAVTGDIHYTSRFDSHSTAIRNIHLSGDIVFANFEGVLSSRYSTDDTKMMILSMPENTTAVLGRFGFNTLNLANNHSMDLGKLAYENTVAKLKANHFNVLENKGPGIVITNRDSTVRIIGYSFGSENSVNDIPRMRKIIGSFSNDIVIVSAHMGTEGQGAWEIDGGMEYFGDEKRGDVLAFSRACIDAGADLVIGHGPHVLRKIESYKNGLILYSLGNFLFDYPGAENQSNIPTASAFIHLDKNGSFDSVRIDCYTLSNGIPLWDINRKAYHFFKREYEHTGQSNLDFDDKNATIIRRRL